MLIQWGYKQIGQNQSASISVYYPLQGIFTNPPIVTRIIKTSAVDDTDRRLFHIFDVGVNSFTVHGNSSATFGINWINSRYKQTPHYNRLLL